MKNLVIILLLSVFIVGTLLFVFDGFRATGYFSFLGWGSEKASVKASLTEGSCIVKFDDLQLDVSNYLSMKKISSSGECGAMFNSNRDKIVNNICSNSEVLGDIILTYAGSTIGNYPIECSEDLVDSDVPITISGEIMALHADDFLNNKAELITQIKDTKTGKVYNLVARDSNENQYLKDIVPGTFVKARGIKDSDKNSFVLGKIDKSLMQELKNNNGGRA